ncbi:MAG: hypothetical protein ABJ242_05055 [Marinomonas sp.]
MTIGTRQIHRIFAAIIGAFVVLHLGNHLLAWGGVDMHTAGLQIVRLIYRNPLSEAVLIAAVTGQIIIGLRLAHACWRTGVDRGWGRLQLGSGLVLAIFLGAHMGAALSARWLSGIDPNFYWPAGTLTIAPLKYGFWPYYLIAVFSLFAHIASALHFHGRAKTARALLTVGTIAAPIVVLPFSGLIYDIALPAEHLEYFANLTALAA